MSLNPIQVSLSWSKERVPKRPLGFIWFGQFSKGRQAVNNELLWKTTLVWANIFLFTLVVFLILQRNCCAKPNENISHRRLCSRQINGFLHVPQMFVPGDWWWWTKWGFLFCHPFCDTHVYWAHLAACLLGTQFWKGRNPTTSWTFRSKNRKEWRFRACFMAGSNKITFFFRQWVPRSCLLSLKVPWANLIN